MWEYVGYDYMGGGPYIFKIWIHINAGVLDPLGGYFFKKECHIPNPEARYEEFRRNEPNGAVKDFIETLWLDERVIQVIYSRYEEILTIVEKKNLCNEEKRRLRDDLKVLVDRFDKAYGFS